MTYKCFLTLMIFVSTYSLYSQCDCMTSAQATGIQQFQIPEEMKSGDAIGKFKLSALYKYIYGDKYFQSNSEAPEGMIDNFNVNYSNLMLTYYLNDKFIFFSDIGYFIKKSQKYKLPPVEVSGSGLSHLSLGAKYSIFENQNFGNELLWTLGGRIPLAKYDSTLPYHIQSSSGAVGLNTSLSYYQSFFDRRLNLMLSIGYDYSFKNDRNYRYGDNATIDLMAFYKLTSAFSVSLGNRIDFRNKDYYYDTTNTASGGIYHSISPGLHYRVSDLLISAIADLPYLRNIYGTQLVTNYSYMLNLSWYFKI